MKMWLDDVRPAPDGWKHVETVDQAKSLLLANRVSDASLDHDLGPCTACLGGLSPLDYLVEHSYLSSEMLVCKHGNTGTDLVRWMAEQDVWPINKPHVHSMNPDGAARMRSIIDKHFTTGASL